VTSACTSQPVSWLRLERYALGELPAQERGAVSAHLDACDACRGCMQEIRERKPADLPPLPDSLLSAPAPWWRRHRLRVAWGGGFAAAAAAAATIALLLLSRDAGVDDGTSVPGGVSQLKGGDVALSLVRESDGSITHDPDAYFPRDRFKVLITCPSKIAVHADVVVYEEGEASFPLTQTAIECGNRVAIPGAFRLTGNAPVTICALLGEDAPPDRVAIASTRPEDLDSAVCTTLRFGLVAP